ncbi:hypothetical protein DFH11DRAFT_1810572 [Phellopilus nigrolimitatus]|nr:hypothetical protein DFH11DRAFT_1810572 [Phellopilus nigrolimitatus]
MTNLTHSEHDISPPLLGLPPEPRDRGYGCSPAGPPPQMNGNSVGVKPGQSGAPSQHSPRGYSSHYDLSAAFPIPSDTWERERRENKERERVLPRRDYDRLGQPPSASNFSHAHSQSRGPASITENAVLPSKDDRVSGQEIRKHMRLHGTEQ